MKKHILLFLPLCVLTACAQSSSDGSVSVYRDATYGFHVSYPSGVLTEQSLEVASDYPTPREQIVKGVALVHALPATVCGICTATGTVCQNPAPNVSIALFVRTQSVDALQKAALNAEPNEIDPITLGGETGFRVRDPYCGYAQYNTFLPLDATHSLQIRTFVMDETNPDFTQAATLSSFLPLDAQQQVIQRVLSSLSFP